MSELNLLKTKNVKANNIYVNYDGNILNILDLLAFKTEITNITGIPPSTLNSIEKVATALNNNPDFFNYVNQQLTLKRNISDSYDKNYINTLITNYYNKTQVDTLFNNIIDGAPTVLNTLNELAAALNDDANYATTIQNQIALKQDLLSVLSLPGQISLLNGNLIKPLQSGSNITITDEGTHIVVNATGITKAMIGLGNVDNTTDK